MLNQYKILTITHRHTNLNELGRYVVQNAEGRVLADRLKIIKEQLDLKELMYLSTCNRVMYLFVYDKPVDSHFILSFFQAVNPLLTDSELDDTEQIAMVYEGEDALRHLFEVAASIDSMVVGEREILRQLRTTYDQCRKWGLTQDYIRLAIQHAVQAAKNVYAKTRIGEKPISIVSLAIQKLLHSKQPKDTRIMLIGAGQTNALVAKFLRKYNFTNIRVFNRSVKKAQELAGPLGGRAFPLNALSNDKEGFDVLIVCTGSTQVIVDQELYSNLLGSDRDTKVIIDLAIPNNVARAVVDKNAVDYIEIDGLRTLAKENLAFREKEVNRVRALLEEYLSEFPIYFRQRQVERALQTVPSEIKAIKQHALDKVFHKRLKTLDSETRELLEEMMSYMEKRCISIPMKAAKEAIR